MNMSIGIEKHHDITHLLTPFFDRQLIIPFLEFLSGKEIYKEEHVLKAKMDLLMGTKMVDAVLEVYEAIGEKIPDGLHEKKESILDEYRKREKAISKVVAAIKTIEEQEGSVFYAL